jgi:1-acyl-sn-glycerol-3-phosphate acyltransferase
VGIAITTRTIETFVKSELRDYPILGQLLEAYGVIWIHRGRPDRRALRAALQALKEGRMLGIAPEGRESLSGALEEGTNGAAYLALKADVPILPVTFTGTENRHIFPNMKRLRRSSVSITIGKLFRLLPCEDFRTSISIGTETIMRKLASQLPMEYRGVYQKADDTHIESDFNPAEKISHDRG